MSENFLDDDKTPHVEFKVEVRLDMKKLFLTCMNISNGKLYIIQFTYSIVLT